ncbi:MAG: CPBP family intramembrane glutamic endopeptidase [Planctomycetota bacterium]
MKIETIFDGIIVGTFIVSIIIWVRRIRSCRGFRDAAESLAPSESRYCPRWTLLDAFLAMLGQMLLFLLLCQWLLVCATGIAEVPVSPEPALESAQPMRTQFSISVASFLTIALVTLFLFVRQTRSPVALGWFGSWRHVKLGVLWSLLLLPPVLLFNSLLSLVVPYEHDVIEQFGELREPEIMAMTLLVTCVVAPLFEEFVYRALFQGGFEAFDSIRRHYKISGRLPTREQVNMFGWRPLGLWPIFAAAAIFCLQHWGQGAGPIALFPLAIGLGWLYRQSGSLVPCVIVHMVLNSFTMLNVYLTLPPA